jgi:hypothetical protein
MPEKEIITREKLKEVARNILDFLESEGIDSIGSVFSKLGGFFNIKGDKGKKYNIQIRPWSSNPRAGDYVIIYRAPEIGFPIKIRLNQDSNYSKIFVKTESRLDNYEFVVPDLFGNFLQSKEMKECSIPIIKRELEKLVS